MEIMEGLLSLIKSMPWEYMSEVGENNFDERDQRTEKSRS